MMVIAPALADWHRAGGPGRALLAERQAAGGECAGRLFLCRVKMELKEAAR